MFLKRSFFKTIVFIKIVVSLTIVNDKPSLTIINDKPSLTIINDKPLLTIVQKRSFFKNNRKKTVANFSKTIIFKNDRYSFSKSSKWVGRFENDIFSETKKKQSTTGSVWIKLQLTLYHPGICYLYIYSTEHNQLTVNTKIK